MKILACDFGLKNIGLAITDGQLVEPFGYLVRKNNKDLIKELKRICLDNNIEQIVIGLPSGKLEPIIKKFSSQLKKKIKLPIVFHDEDLTSKIAVKKMVEANKPLKKRKKHKHIISACLILESYLDQAIYN